ncbi:MAG: GspH/FimT family pseudopilin [Betaproteobacteria bacterium]
MRRSESGFSLIELLVAMAIMAILFALAIPAYKIWISNAKIRTTAESIQNGLQLARGEAVRRNSPIRFQLVDSTNVGCALSTTVSNWVVSYDNPVGACNAGLLDEAFPVTDTTKNPSPRIIRVRSVAEGSSNIDLAADQSDIIFNGLGRVTTGTATPPPSLVAIEVVPKSTIGSCATLRCLRVTVSAGGQIRMCDPQLTVSKPSDPQAC